MTIPGPLMEAAMPIFAEDQLPLTPRQDQDLEQRRDMELMYLREIESKIKRLPPSDTSALLDPVLIDKELCRYPGYKPGSYTQGHRVYPKMKGHSAPELGYQYMRYVFTKLRMKPSINPYKWLNRGEDISIPLPDIEVILDIDTCKCCVRAVGHAPSYALENNDHAVHPHILTGQRPCLGDFQAGIQTAITDFDPIMCFLLFKSFLEQASTEDSAGKRWIQGILDQIRHVVHPQFTTPGSYPEPLHISHRSYGELTTIDGDNIMVELDALGRAQATVTPFVPVDYESLWAMPSLLTPTIGTPHVIRPTTPVPLGYNLAA